MRMAERVAEVLADLGDVAVGHRALARGAVKRLSLYQLRDEKGVPVAFAQLIKSDDRGMVEPRRRLSFAQDAVGTRGLDLLDRDLPLEALVKRLVDGAHPAGADSLSDPEPPHYEFA